MSHDDFAAEPINGLPELPPRGEVILWQGRPNWFRLTVESLNLWWVIAYFAVLTAWRFITVIDVLSFERAIIMTLPFVIMTLIVVLLLMLVGFIQARATVYTITNRRVAMRIGAALTVTLNIPYTQIDNAAVSVGKAGCGNIALETKGDSKFSYLVLWPHIRSWKISKPEPTLRAIPDVQSVAQILAKAAKARIVEVENKEQSNAPELGAVV
ncbi:MAG: PH domain-containing protein [Rhodobacteraceae bacterium]|nr:PH domain-containing protein [Paracoccaceae bacterium]